MAERVARERKTESGKRRAGNGVLMWLWWLEGFGRKKSRAGRRGISQ